LSGTLRTEWTECADFRLQTYCLPACDRECLPLNILTSRSQLGAYQSLALGKECPWGLIPFPEATPTWDCLYLASIWYN
jgi:hypothetical protein